MTIQFQTCLYIAYWYSLDRVHSWLDVFEKKITKMLIAVCNAYFVSNIIRER